MRLNGPLHLDFQNLGDLEHRYSTTEEGKGKKSASHPASSVLTNMWQDLAAGNQSRKNPALSHTCEASTERAYEKEVNVPCQKVLTMTFNI